MRFLARLEQLLDEGLGPCLALAGVPFGGVDKYLDYLHAQAALKWDGRQPQIVAGNGSSTNLVVPIPALGQVSQWQK